MLHILVGDAEKDTEFLLKARNKRPFPWIVPMKAQTGERVLFYLPKHGFVGRAILGSEPHLIGFKKCSARIRNLVLLPTSVPLAFIRESQPEWGWPRYPRTYTTIDGSTESRLAKLLEDYQFSINGGWNDEGIENRTEGGRKSVMTSVFERDPIARRECINHFGTSCFICGFSFGDCYGESADGYIHVHHLRPVSRSSGRHFIDPTKDLRPLCPNCHVVVHLRNPPFTVVEVKKMRRAQEVQ